MTSQKKPTSRLNSKYGTPQSEPFNHPLSPSSAVSNILPNLSISVPIPGTLRPRPDSAAPLVSSPPIFTQQQVELARSAASSRAPSPLVSPLSSPSTRPALLSEQFAQSKPRQRI